MRPLCLALVLLASPLGALAERQPWKATDFQPLTSLPWQEPSATLESVLQHLFREPDREIRYPVLAEYLRLLPVDEFDRAFELCVRLEGAQTPNDLVELILGIWAERNPIACWEKTRKLFRLVGTENGWLQYDGWSRRDGVKVRDRDALRQSAFWLEPDALRSFPIGVGRSALAPAERLRLLKEFAAAWFAAFESWPGYDRPSPPGYSNWQGRILEIFGRAEALRGLVNGGHYSNGAEGELEFQINLRRWMSAQPGDALEIIKEARDDPSVELLAVWATADLPGIVRWAESLEWGKDELAPKARGFLLSRVDAGTRTRWLVEAKKQAEDRRRLNLLLEHWAPWDPTAALEFAAPFQDAEVLLAVVSAATFGPWRHGAVNTWHFGIGAVKNFDILSLPPAMRTEVIADWSQFVMEPWGEIDIGETARYGLDFMLRTGSVPQEGLLKFFSGRDLYPDDGGMIDRTFCALRVWAMTKPEEMKRWITTLGDGEMRKALTWLLERPQGEDPRPEK